MYVREINDSLFAAAITPVLQATEGLAQLPDDLTSLHAELRDYLAQHASPHGTIDEPHHEQAVTKLTTKLAQQACYGTAETLITECLQPALAAHLAQFKQHAAVAAKYLHHTGATAELLMESEPVRLAYVGLTESISRYGTLRQAWESMRHRAQRHTVDPQGTQGLIAEIRNAPEVFDDWQRAGTSHLHPWPWQGGNHWIRMNWLLDHGARIWLPTATEQDSAYRHYVPLTRAVTN